MVEIAGMIYTIKMTVTLLNATLTSYVWYQRNNANTEIKKAERIIANFQVAKMQGKAGSSADKTTFITKATDAFNAYIVGTSTYNASEAQSRAHELQAKAYKSSVQKIIVVQMVLNVVANVVTGYVWKVPIIITVSLVTLLTSFYQKEAALHVVNMLQSGKFIGVITEFMYALLAYYSVIPTGLRWLSAATYIVLSVIVTVL